MVVKQEKWTHALQKRYWEEQQENNKKTAN